MVMPRRGEIWWVRQPLDGRQAGDLSGPRRPYLVVSGDPWNVVEGYPRITLCPLTGIEHVTRRYETDVVLRARETGLSKDSVVRCVEVYTLFRDRLDSLAGRAPPASMKRVDRALALYLALPADPGI